MDGSEIDDVPKVTEKIIEAPKPPAPPVEEDKDFISQKESEEFLTRKPINWEHANSVYSFDGKDKELAQKYSEGVRFDADGYPDFSPYAAKTAEIAMTGDRVEDYKRANVATGLEDTPEGYTWHHHQDMKTMQLVPEDLHGAVRHTGGVALLKRLH